MRAAVVAMMWAPSTRAKVVGGDAAFGKLTEQKIPRHPFRVPTKIALG
jgi:hypothetical protein